MLVTEENLEEVVEGLVTGTYAVDVETTGLRAYHGDKLFSLIIASEKESWYFNFQEYPGLENKYVLPRRHTFDLLQGFFENPANVFFLHNAKFDMAMLAKEGVVFGAAIYDTEVMGRLLYNRHMKYNLESLAAQIGLEKSNEVYEYIAKHKLFTWVQSPGKEKRAKQPHFDQVPFEIISRYGERDGDITRKLGMYQLDELAKLSSALTTGARGGSTLMGLLDNEVQLTKTCFEMEQVGIKIDRVYCQVAYEHATDCMARAVAEFEDTAGMEFKDSRVVLAKAFTKAGEKYPVTEKGNPSFTDEVLEGFTSPLAQLIRNYRGASKRANTYFANFMYFADDNDRIHPNMRQAGTDTGRFSFSEPNLQNVPTDDTGPFPVRRAFIPSGPDWTLVSIDFEQMEYRLLLDYANERDVIRSILEGGLDVHQATADKMGVDRKSAKTLNFLLLYGGGAQKLADTIGVSLRAAEELKEQYFEALPGIRRFSKGIADKANVEGLILNWAKRVCHFPYMMNPKTGVRDRFAYRAANHCIQGGCADIVKIAMNRCHAYLSNLQSRLILQVHDELVYEIHDSELSHVPKLQALMETSYPHLRLPLTCSVESSKVSWAD
jgi:DNA polymerase-1